MVREREQVERNRASHSKLITAVESLIPLIEEYGVTRLLLARPPVSAATAPVGMRLRPKPMHGRGVRLRGPGTRGQITTRWIDDRQVSIRFPYLCLVLNGEAHFRTDDAIVYCPAGYGILIPPDVPMTDGEGPHWEGAKIEDAYSDVFWLQFRPAGVEYYVCHSRGPIHDGGDFGEIGYANHRHLYQLSEMLFDEMAQRESGYEELSKTYLLSILTLLRRHMEGDESSPPRPLSRHVSDLKDPKLRNLALSRAQDFINGNLGKRITLHDIARAAFISRSSLAQLFRSETGGTVWDYVTARRIEEAQTLLRETDISIREIGVIVGFPQLSHFSARFTGLVGQAPGTYRRCSREMNGG